MKIFIIVDDYLPDSTKVAGKMMHELAIEFKRSGNQVTVLTPSPNIDTKFEISNYDQIPVIRFKSGKIKNTNRVLRAKNESLLSINSWRYLKQFFITNHHDAIVFYSPTIFWGQLVKKLKILWISPAYMVLRDFFPQWVIDNNLIREKSLIASYFRYMEKLNYKAADCIGIQSEKNIEWFNKNHQTTATKSLLFNWVEDKCAEYQGCEYRKKYNLFDKIILFYGGNMGHAQDMMNILRLANSLHELKNVLFFLVGDGDEFSMIENEIYTNQMENIILLHSVPQSEYKKMLVEFDIGLFSLHKNHITHNFPGKLLGYLVNRMPILGSVNPDNDLISVISDYQVGLVTVNGDDETFIKNAKELISGSELREKMAANCTKLLVEKFSVGTAASQIIEDLKSCRSVEF